MLPNNLLPHVLLFLLVVQQTLIQVDNLHGQTKTLKMQVREYGSGNEQKIYNSTYWDGSGGNEFQVPSLTITSLDNQMTDEEKLEQLRTSRDLLLMNTDAWALVDRNMSQEQKDYRQVLRDITKTYKSLDDVKCNKPDK